MKFQTVFRCRPYRLVLGFALAACAFPCLLAAAAKSYSLAVPGAPVLRDTTDATSNVWLSSNNVFAAAASFVPVSSGGTSMRSSSETASLDVFMLASSVAGFAIQRIQPQYYLSDEIVPPDDVDWTATWALFQTNTAENSNFLFDPQGQRVFAIVGGNQTLTWVTSTGDRIAQTYVIASVVQGRPYRLFWTDHPYDAPSISLSGKFVKFYGDASIVNPVYGVQTNLTGGLVQIISNAVVRGVYLDPSTKLLSVYGDVRGQFVLAYYDSGAYDTLKHVEVVEVGPPDVIEMTGEIGKSIEPSGSGYGVVGLTPSPRADSATDNRGDYYYQHKGQFSYSPKNNYVFPLRPTVGESWRLPVYWMENDPFATAWPFELCHYSCDWGSNVKTVVAGGKVLIPSDYTPTLMGYQEPEGHARAPANNEFTTTGAGLSLLKLTTSDNVWFIPFRAVLRTDPNYFTLEAGTWLVGEKVVPRGGSVSGTSSNYTPSVDSSVAGYINKAESGNNYNPDLYIEPASSASQTNMASSSSGDTNTYASVIYAVTTNANPLEVWWSDSFQDEGMPSAVTYPTLVQRYAIAWPDPVEVPQIVLASQQGSAAPSAYQVGSSLVFDSSAGSLAISPRKFFWSDEASISFWAGDLGGSTGTHAVLTLGYGGIGVDVDVISSGTDTCYRLAFRDTNNVEVAALTTAGMLPIGEWYKILFTVDGTSVCAYVDGELSASTNFAALPDLSGWRVRNAIGAIGTRTALPDLMVDNLATWCVPFTADEASNSVYESLSGSEEGLTCLYTFGDDDLVPVIGSNRRTALERVHEVRADALDVLSGNGAPGLGAGIIEADATPVVYRQNDPAQTGYNPNEEHAIVTTGSGGYVVWALRCDLNTPDSSEPGVLVQYVKDGKKAMKYFSVLLTNEVYTALADSATVGTTLPGPLPLTMLDDPWLDQTYWDTVTNKAIVAFRDRKKQVWSRCAGLLPIHMYYPNQDGFDYPSVPTNALPAIGAAIPWLSSLDKSPDKDVNLGKPATWTWNVAWPANLETMRIGQTLTTASGGLPEVWNAASMAVVYPVDANKTVLLYDPTVIQHAGPADTSVFATVPKMVAALGFDTDPNGNATLRSGKYRLKDLPPTISDRFYIDSTLGISKCLCLEGVKESKTGGGTILYVNVLSTSERSALKGTVTSNNTYKTTWDTMIDQLATAPVVPSPSAWASSSTGETNVLAVAYVPRDHYALTAMGATNYVVLIENDATNSLMSVKTDDPISMHVFAVTNEYYAGAVYARQDPENLLSQQLSILYAESFAGKPDNFVFEWKKANPNANGTIPTDYENVFKRKFDLADSVGLTRFVLGAQGDTLADLVNTYYVCRYRAKDSSVPAYAVMGDAWSDWCGPTLAEGWVQRVMNNITPFSQRMTDLYDNSAEMVGTAIQAAGAPYQGDVALNQDNLTSVGLIQLYQTVLNKAESMSLTLGVNNDDANKQLLLAVERLADLYVVLGNEAYTDAMNPTIGFGSTYGASGVGMTTVDYGAESSSLFCFDNQVSTLLDEELALLRGRTGANAPAVTVAPYYNRLVWNFTKGITAGEVAYAVNYNINSTDNNATIDAEDAAVQYPQGHGDAYGHYLSALSGYYRLLRNPYFSWVVGMGEMLVNDAVVNEDYYDEERFAEIAAKLAQTAQDTVDRTARQAWRDNGGVAGAGYLDSDTSRNFGYGEWGTRGGVGAVMNWMVANSLLPEAEDASFYYRLRFDGTDTLSLDRAPTSSAEATNGVWTFECQVAPDMTNAFAGTVLDWTNETAWLGVIISNGTWRAFAASLAARTVAITNQIVFAVTNSDSTVSNVSSIAVDYETVYATNLVAVADLATSCSYGILAVSRAADGTGLLRLLGADGSVLATVDLQTVVPSEGAITFGAGFHGYIDELRFWSGSRTAAELAAAAAYVSPRAEALISCARGVTRRNTDLSLVDEVGADVSWTISAPVWTSVAESGLALAFTDTGLLRIDRSSVTDLQTLCDATPAIQRTLDKLDAGLNPLGFSESAIPFDITPLGASDGSCTHFEQVYSRAKTALANAGKVLDRAQSLGNRLRMIQNAVSDEEELDAASEADYNKQLIELFGYPYSDDIGPSGTYAQGYDGPDLYHYMWMDLSKYGLSSADDLTAQTLVTYDLTTGGWSYAHLMDLAKPDYKSAKVSENGAITSLSFALSANGLIVKPSGITGTRQAVGKLQQAYADYIAQYQEVKSAIEVYEEKTQALSYEVDASREIFGFASALFAAKALNITKDLVIGAAKLNLKNANTAIGTVVSTLETSAATLRKVAPSIVGVGMTVNTDPSAIVSAAIEPGKLTTVLGLTATAMANTIAIDSFDYIGQIGDSAVSGIEIIKTLSDDTRTAKDRLIAALEAQHEAAANVESTWAKMIAAQDAIDALVAEGERIQTARANTRAKTVNRLTKLRYNDMYFRQVQNQALTRYSAAFDLAQKYCFLAAQAYDYETGLLSADKTSGDAFRAEIIGSRTLGRLNEGEPMLGDGVGDPGLSDILARMDANWLVLKGRLGINNPESYATWFSLRSELFRISSASNGLKNWQTELAKYWVDDLRTLPEYTRYCQPFTSSSGLNTKEPGLVIPFSTDIDFGKNFFGQTLAAGDSAYDSTYYATKIAGIGVRFAGYNAAVNGYSGSSVALASTPVVYLLPVGADRMRVPGSGEKGTVLDFNVVDQVVPVPYAIGSTELDDPDWIPLYNGYTGNVDLSARIRRYPSFRAVTGEASDAGLACTRLIGRSAWNTRWVMIIPAGQLLGGTAENRDAALKAFIYGKDLDRDGVLDIGGITDIQLGLKTYSNSGN